MWTLLWLGTALGGELTLDEALHLALDHNLEAQAAHLRRERADASVLAAAGLFDPRLNLGVNQSSSASPTNDKTDGVDTVISSSAGWNAGLTQTLPTGGSATLTWTETLSTSNSEAVVSTDSASDSARLSVSQPLLDGGGFRAGMYSIRAARLGRTDAGLEHRATMEQLVLDVSDAYWRLVSAQESADLADKSADIAEQSLLDTEERFDEGFAGSGDVHQVERALGVARQAQVVAQSDLEAAEERLRRILGLPIGAADPVVPVDRPQVPATDPEPDAVLASARQHNARWLRDELAAERALEDLRLARNDFLPDLSVTGSVGLTGLRNKPAAARRQTLSGENNDWALGASVSVPIPYREGRANLSMARIDHDTATLSLEAAEQDLLLRVRDAVRAVKRDRSRLELAEHTVEVARLALQADQELLRDGRGSPRNVVVSLESLDQAQAAHLAAQIDLQRSLLELQRVGGTLLPSLGL